MTFNGKRPITEAVIKSDDGSGTVGVNLNGELSVLDSEVSGNLVTLINTVATQATLAAVSSSLSLLRAEVALEATQLLNSQSLDAIRLTDGVAQIRDQLPSGTNNLGYTQVIDPSSGRAVNIFEDTIDGVDRLRIEGKVSIVSPTAPSGTIPVIMTSSGSLSISSTSGVDDVYLLTSGSVFTLQSIVAGSEGDSTEAGSVIEVFYNTASVDNIISRIYINGFSTQISPNTSTTRAGISLTGSGGGERIILRRRRLSGGSQELDAVLRGFETT